MENKLVRPCESLTDAFKRGHGHGHGPRSWSRPSTYLMMGDFVFTLKRRTSSYLSVHCVVRPVTLLVPTRVSASGSRAGAGRDRPSAQCAMQHDFTPHTSRASLCTYSLEMMILLHAMRYGSLGVVSIMLMPCHVVDQRGPSVRGLIHQRGNSGPYHVHRVWSCGFGPPSSFRQLQLPIAPTWQPKLVPLVLCVRG